MAEEDPSQPYRFSSVNAYFTFCQEVLITSRFAGSTETEAFLNAVLETADERVLHLPANTVLWRAQIGPKIHAVPISKDQADGVIRPMSPTRMLPRPLRGPEGRVNPKGIPVLYLAQDQATAIAEVRPWVGSLVTVAQVCLTEDVRIVDCSRTDEPAYAYEVEDPTTRENAVWGEINRAFSVPVTASDDVAGYAPTQILADHFRRGGFDGIAYASSSGEGTNIALFDCARARIAQVDLVSVSQVSYKTQNLTGAE